MPRVVQGAFPSSRKHGAGHHPKHAHTGHAAAPPRREPLTELIAAVAMGTAHPASSHWESGMGGLVELPWNLEKGSPRHLSDRLGPSRWSRRPAASGNRLLLLVYR
jgi:hypothetical protein